MRNLTEEMERAARDKDEETRVELESETRRVREQMQRLEEEAQRLESEYRRERSQFQVQFAELGRERREGTIAPGTRGQPNTTVLLPPLENNS